MRLRPYSALCLLLLCCPGCGLLVVPTIEAFPAPVRHISVCDALTGAAVPSASVDVQVIYVSTKANLFQTSGTNPRDPDGEVVRLGVTPEGQGTFTPDGTLRLAFWQCLFPLFSWATPGDWWYYGHKTRIQIGAPGYDTVSIEYPAWSAPTSISANRCSVADGTLTVRLPHSNAQ